MRESSGAEASHGSIVLDRVRVELDGRAVLHDVSLRLEAPRIAVIGANGSGKSTFARLLDGLVVPTAGTALVHGLDVARDTRELRRRVGFVFTDPDAQILMPTPAEDLALSLRNLPRAEVGRRVRETLEAHGLEEHADVSASSLSGGQKQLLALAAVLVTGPRLLVADEPTTLLDRRNARRIADLLMTQEAQVVVATHDLDLAARCDIAVLFAGGRIAALGRPDTVIDEYCRVSA